MNSRHDISVLSDLWVSCSKPNPQAPIRLFCFPYAGAGSSMFNAWSNLLEPEIELCLIHLPGRDRRIREPLQRDVVPLIEALTQGISSWLDKPFAFLGHSMGALLAFETIRQLRRNHLPQPAHLFLSARIPPQLVDPHLYVYQLPEDQFRRETERLYGALPAIIKEDHEILNLFLAILRADLTMLGTYQYQPEPPLACPLSLFGGMQDPSITEEQLQGWQAQTSSSFRLTMLPGDHFFVQTSKSRIAQQINEELAAVLHK